MCEENKFEVSLVRHLLEVLDDGVFVLVIERVGEIINNEERFAPCGLARFHLKEHVEDVEGLLLTIAKNLKQIVALDCGRFATLLELEDQLEHRVLTERDAVLVLCAEPEWHIKPVVEDLDDPLPLRALAAACCSISLRRASVSLKHLTACWNSSSWVLR
jgi:hypothetical protein